MKKLMPLLALVILLSGCWGCVPASPAESSGTADRPTPPATQTILDSPIPSAEAIRRRISEAWKICFWERSCW
jgi:PBP1b-binding outer membrane lipoprotein LpoB